MSIPRVVFSYSQVILVPLPGAFEKSALRAINEANGRDPNAPFTSDDICRMSANSARLLTIDVYSDGTRRVRGACDHC
jgi:hypothetical protein